MSNIVIATKLIKDVIQVFNDLATVHAPDFCDPEYVESAEARMSQWGGIDKCISQNVENLKWAVMETADHFRVHESEEIVKSINALNDLAVTVGKKDQKGSLLYDQAMIRILDNGGTLAYIADRLEALEALEAKLSSKIEEAKKSVRIVMIPEHEPTQIKGYCQIPGWQGEQEVISLSRNFDRWVMGMSMAMPSDIEQARVVNDCYNRVFEALDKLQSVKRK